MIVSEREIRLCIMEPTLESAVLELLSAAGMECSARHLHPEEIPRENRPQTILIVSASTSRSSEHVYEQMGFLALIEVDQKNVNAVVERINRISSERTSASETLTTVRRPLVIGVMPRVGATLLEDLLERELSTEIFALRNRFPESAPQIFCTEIDDSALTQLFNTIGEIDTSAIRVGVVVNKVAKSTLARRKLQALERELRAVAVELICPIFLDSQLQISGAPSKETIHAIRPLFDWMRKAN